MLGRGVARCRPVEALLLIAVTRWRATMPTISRGRTTEATSAIRVAVVVTLARPVTAVATRAADANRSASLDQRSHLIGLLLGDSLVLDEFGELLSRMGSMASRVGLVLSLWWGIALRCSRRGTSNTKRYAGLNQR